MFFVNTIGAELKNTFRLNNAGFPCNRTPMNITETVYSTVYLTRPDNSLLSYGGSLYTDGTDGIIEYSTASGDLDQAGLYQLQASILTPSGIFYSDRQFFQVLETL